MLLKKNDLRNMYKFANDDWRAFVLPISTELPGQTAIKVTNTLFCVYGGDKLTVVENGKTLATVSAGAFEADGEAEVFDGNTVEYVFGRETSVTVEYTGGSKAVKLSEGVYIERRELLLGGIMRDVILITNFYCDMFAGAVIAEGKVSPVGGYCRIL